MWASELGSDRRSDRIAQRGVSLFASVTKYYYLGEKIKKVETGGACCTYTREEKRTHGFGK